MEREKEKEGGRERETLCRQGEHSARSGRLPEVLHVNARQRAQQLWLECLRDSGAGPDIVQTFESLVWEDWLIRRGGYLREASQRAPWNLYPEGGEGRAEKIEGERKRGRESG